MHTFLSSTGSSFSNGPFQMIKTTENSLANTTELSELLLKGGIGFPVSRASVKDTILYETA